MATCRNFLNLTKKKRIFLYRSNRSYSSSAEVKTQSNKIDEIIIPYRIHRGPTDILKALASTISKDYTAPKYKYEDDPYLIPSSNITKRAFALSKESGRKAARYFLEKYPELFVCNESVPHIKAYNPPPVYTTENVTSPDVLAECINNFEVDNSIKVYKILKEKGFVVSQEIKQNLLELLCYNNGAELPAEDYYEERYFQKQDHRGERWNAKGEAERLFDEMEKDSKAYSALISGACKFQDSERALQLHNEMTSKDIIPTVEAYNGLISIIPWMREKSDSGCEYALYMLGHMRKAGLVPTLYTFNAVLDVFSRRRFRKVSELTLSVLAEMKNLNIEPSLGTYHLIISLLCDETHCKIGALYETVQEIEGKEFTVRHPWDVKFFTTAMEKCYKMAHDKNLAYRINKTVELGQNCKLLGSAISESIYFKYFLKMLCETEDFERFMEVYDQYVPNTYTPEPSLMLEVLQSLEFSGLYQHLPKLGTDVYVFEHTERENILYLLFEIAGSMKFEVKLQKELIEVIWKIVSKLNTRLKARRYNFSWTGQLLGNALNTFVHGKDMQKSWEIMKQLTDIESVIGPPSKESLLNFCELFLENRDYEKVRFCIKYAVNEVFPEFIDDFKTLAGLMLQKGQLEEKHMIHVNNILQSVSLDKSASLTDSSSSSSSSSDLSSGGDSSSSEEEDDDNKNTN